MSTLSAVGRNASGSEIELGSLGWPEPAVPVGSVGPAARTCALSQRFTGWDDDGGFAEYALIDEQYAYPLPGDLSNVETAPLLCAGSIGYRALRRANLPRFVRLGFYGFGASAHLAAQTAIREGGTVHVLTRSAQARELAISLGAASARDATDGPPEPLDASIPFAPAGDLVPTALRDLDQGGTLAVTDVHLSDVHLSDIPPLI